MYGKIIDGTLVYAPKDLVMSDGRVVFDYYQDIQQLMQDGYKEVIQNVPVYNKENQYVMLMGYSEEDTTIEVLYQVYFKENTDIQKEHFNKCVSIFAQSLPDDKALEVYSVYPEFGRPNHYKKDEKFRYNGALYKVLLDHDTQDDWLPDNAPSLYTRLIASQPGEAPKEWEQPNANNAYMNGDRVICEGKVYESTIDNNVWKPTEYPQGWKIVEEE